MPRMIGTLKGDIDKVASDRIKYGLMFQTLADIVELVEVYDTSLGGIQRVMNAVRSFHPSLHRWRQRFYKNIPAFVARSKTTASYLQARQSAFDIIFQVGVLYDARWNDSGPPSIIYTDYTAHLSRQKQDSGRSPFTDAQVQRWLALEQRAFQHADHICTRAAYVRDSVIQDYGIPADKVTAIGGGVEFAELPSLPQKQHQDDSTKPVNVLFIGKDFYRKGGDILLQAWTRANLTNAHLRMVTANPPDLQLTTQTVEVLPPTWDRDKIAQYFRDADIFVLPSRLETWGDVLLEAMAYEVPCIGVSGEAMEEIISDGETGLIVPPQDVEALAHALAHLAHDLELRQKWGRAGRRRLEQQFTWAVVMQKLRPIIDNVYKGQKTSAPTHNLEGGSEYDA